MHKSTYRNRLSRRKFLAVTAATFGSTAAGSALRAAGPQQPSAPANVRLGLGKRALTPGDISFVGWFRLPKIDNHPGCANDFMFAQGACASRVVAGTRRFLIAASGDDFPLVEIAHPGSLAPTMTTNTPMAPLMYVWGDCYGGRRVCQGSAPSYVHGYFWDGEKLWWQYGDTYAGQNHHNPSIACSVLDDNDRSIRVYGPWRTDIHSQRSRGWMTAIPASFSSAYCPGMTVGLGTNQTSGYGLTPYGPNLHAFALPALSTPPSAVDDDRDIAIRVMSLIFFDEAHRFTRPDSVGRYRRFVPETSSGPFACGEGPYGDAASAGTARGGLSVNRYPANFLPSNKWAEQLDETASVCWVDLPDKHGVIWFGSLCTKVEGYNAPNDPLGLPHFGYGEPAGGTGTGATDSNGCFGGGDCAGTRAPKRCFHDQDDPWWAATGPWCHASVPYVFIADPAELGKVAVGQTAAPWQAPIASVTRLSGLGLELSSHPSGRYARTWAGTPTFDAANRLIYLPVKDADNTGVSYYPRWAMAVFSVS